MKEKQNNSESDFIVKLKTFTSSVGMTTGLFIIFLIVHWLIYTLRATKHLEGVPTWLIPSADFYLLWVILLKLFTCILASVWLVAYLWHNKLQQKQFSMQEKVEQ